MRTTSTFDRRRFLKLSSAALAALPAGCIARPLPARSVYESLIPAELVSLTVNDVHSQLNATRVARIEKPRDVEALASAVAQARGEGRPLPIGDC